MTAALMPSRSSDRSPAEQRLRDAIADGGMAPGHRLVEADLVALLGVSRSSVRLAIDTLTAEGLVERVPNRDARVRVVSVPEAVAITECRMALEGLIARRRPSASPTLRRRSSSPSWRACATPSAPVTSSPTRG
jgi:DNA-binding GntR family transcriptional regulator